MKNLMSVLLAGIMSISTLATAHDYKQVDVDLLELSIIKLRAEQGDATAQVALAEILVNGKLGAQPDLAQAAHWYEQAANQGNPAGQYNMGVMHLGYGLPTDYDMARQWFEKAAANQVSQAQYNLGVIYTNGYGVQQDYIEASKWFYESCNNINPTGCAEKQELSHMTLANH